jgi:membrane-associated phospholipid phosphatase
MKKNLLLVFVFSLCTSVFAESNFSFDMKKDLIIGGGALGLFTAHFFVENQIWEIEHDNAFDNFFSSPYKKWADMSGDVAVYTLGAAPLLFIINNLEDTGKLFTYAVMYSEVLLLTFSTAGLTKNLVGRLRPYNFYDDSVRPEKTDDYNKSFPSRHTAFAFAGAGFITALLLGDYAGSKWNPLLIAAAYTAAAAIGVSRIEAGMHFATDVLAGAALGSLVGYGVPLLHLQKNDGGTKVMLSPFSVGVRIQL